MEDRFTMKSPDNKWQAEISACQGANILKLQYRGNNVLVPLESEKQLKKDPFVQGSPLLLPANRTAGGKFTFQGKEYTLPINDKKKVANLHGSLYRQVFSVLYSGEECVVLAYENHGEIYPFAFCITVEYQLTNHGLLETIILENRAQSDMPYTFALHTTFIEPRYFSVPIVLQQEKDENHIPTGRYIPLSKEERQYISGCSPVGKEISGYYKANGRTAMIGDYTYTVSEQFDHVVLFNARGNAGHLCVEPQVGAVNGLNLPGGCRVIPAGGKEVLAVKIERKI